MTKRHSTYRLILGQISDVNGKLISEIQLFKTGEFEHWSGKSFTVDDTFMDSMIENFKALQARSKDEHVVVIDYNHGTEYGGTDPESQKAAGWITDLIKKQDGLYARVEWTKNAAEYIKNGEYKYISPTFLPDGANDEYGEEIEGAFLFSAALLNTPFFKGMEPVAVAAKDKKEEQMEKNKIGKILGLSGEFDEKEVCAAIEDQQKVIAEAAKTLGIKEGTDLSGGVKAVLAERDSAKAEVEKLTAKIAELDKQKLDADAKEKVEKLLREDKIDPAQKEEFIALAKEAPKHFEAITAKLSAKRRMTVSGDGGNEDESTVEGDFDSEVRRVMKEDKLGYIAASRKVQQDNPDLAKKHRDSTGKKTKTVN